MSDDWKRAVLLIEYQSGMQGVFEFTDLEFATFQRHLLPGVAGFIGYLELRGTMTALRAMPELEPELDMNRNWVELPRGDHDGDDA